MLNAQEIQGHWSSIQGKIKERWGQLTDDDLKIVGGNVDQLIGRLQQKTGETRANIESFVNQLMESDAGSMVNRAKETATQYATEMGDRAREGYEQMAERVGMYREGITHAKPVGCFINNQIAALCVTHCAENDEEARSVAGPEGAWFVRMAENLYAPWQGRKVPDSYQFAVSAVQQERAGKTVADHIQSGAFAMGNPDTVIKVLTKYQEAGVDQILCFMQMGNLAHARIMDSIRLFGRHVIPAFTEGVHTEQ